MVSAAVAGDDLQSVVASASEALGRPVAIALPVLGTPVVWPAEAGDPELLSALLGYAEAAIRGEAVVRRPELAEIVPIRIGHDQVGIVAALGSEAFGADQRAWLEAAAAAAAVSALMRESQDGGLDGARRAFVLALAARPPADAGAMVAQARRLGFELSSGAVAICARGGGSPPALEEALAADCDGQLIALVPNDLDLDAIVAELHAAGMEVATSMPRRDPAGLHDALREAQLMLVLSAEPDAMLAGQEETYRLLVGVLLRDPGELEALRATTISPLADYDAEHATELLATLQEFLVHHGSTTETAEAMSLHRHTVGYRLSRVHEVSGLSPYESDGRERLSLGLKAHRILEADRRDA